VFKSWLVDFSTLLSSYEYLNKFLTQMNKLPKLQKLKKDEQNLENNVEEEDDDDGTDDEGTVDYDY
jgi:hypothetical protein